jgi:hypothetical protein
MAETQWIVKDARTKRTGLFAGLISFGKVALKDGLYGAHDASEGGLARSG